MKKNTIVVYQEGRIPCFRVKERHIKRLRAGLVDSDIIWCRTLEQYLEALPLADSVLSWQFKQEWFDRAPHLRKIGSPAAGRDLFEITALPEHIEIMNGTFHGAIMAETIVGMLLAVNRGILSAYKAQLEGDLWPNEPLFEIGLIAGSHAVIVGFGRIGQYVSRMLKPFGVRITGIRRSLPVADPDWFESGDSIQQPDKLHELLADADHVIMLLPSDTDTDNFMGKREFECMPQNAVIYNFGRGNSIDEIALADALRAGTIKGACLDVFAEEPLLESSPLSDGTLPGLVRMPHSSAFCESYIDRFIDEVIEWFRE